VEELFAVLVVIAAAAGAGWLVTRPSAVFVVKVRGGKPVAARGKVTDQFLSAIDEVCAEFAVTSAEILGVAHGKRIALQFSSAIPEPARQRIRNWWVMSGWAAQPGR
jgi:hypothetical protein